ncbi:hypothetical protein Tco_1229810 [Tanacetum coccineum]
MGDEHLSTIPEMESDEVIKSSVTHVPIPIDSRGFIRIMKDVPKENFKIYSNPLFDDEGIISTKIDPHYFNAESNLIESLLNRDTLIDSSPKFDYFLEEFPEELNEEIAETILDSLSPSLIPIEDSDSHMEEIDLFLATDDSMPPGIENDDYDLEGDIHFLE